MKAYDRLAKYYEPEWSSFAERFAPMIDAIVTRHAGERATVLDVACGMGTLALALARRGHTVHGVDRSEAMIERARSLSGDVAGVSFSVGDMRVPLPDSRRSAILSNAAASDRSDVLGVDGEATRGFDAATCTFDSINYLTSPEDVLAMFRVVVGALRPRGVFVFDSNTERMYRTHEDGIYEHELDGEVFFFQETYYDRSARQATTVFRFDDGTMEVHRQRPYGLDELTPLLERAGLFPVETYSGIAFEPYEGDCDRVVVEALVRNA